MSFANLSPLAFAAGLATLAGALFLLQRLRVRHREVDVVTTLFWREAVEEARARVLVQRFRHRWAYLLVLIIAGLLWLAVAGPRVEAEAPREVLLLLDGSAATAPGERFAAAREALLEDVAELAPAARRVLWCGPGTRSLLLPGESELLLEQRLEGLEPAVAPASVEATLLSLAASRPGGAPLLARIYGDAPLRPELLALLPAALEVERAALEGEPPSRGRGVTALGVSPALSGTPNRVDVLIEISGEDLAAAPAPTVALDGLPLASAALLERAGPGRARLVLRDLTADGARLEVRLEPDERPGDDAAARILPERPRLRVAVSPSVGGALVDALAADPALILVEEAPDVAVRPAGEGFFPEVPALVLADSEQQLEAFLITHDGGESSREALLHSLARLGLDRIDATGLAEVAGRPIELGARPGARREVGLWQELLGADYDLVQTRAFPLFVASSMRWLAGVEDFAPSIAAGRPLAGVATPHAAAGGPLLDPVGADFTPPRAGDWRTPGGEVAVASLLDPLLTTVSAAAAPLPQALEGEDGGATPLVALALLLALVLLVCEWALYRSQRIP